MGILFNISSLWFSACMTALIIGGPLNFTRQDYIGFSLGLIIGALFILLCILLTELFPNNGGWV